AASAMPSMPHIRLDQRAAAGLVLLVIASGTAFGGAITLEPTLRTTVAEATVRTTLAVRNTGTDAAHDVTPRLRFADVERTGALVRDLPPGRAHEWTVEFPRPPAATRCCSRWRTTIQATGASPRRRRRWWTWAACSRPPCTGASRRWRSTARARL